MNPVTLFLTLGTIYFVLVAYGVVRTRKRHLPKQVRIAAAAAQVILPPLIMFAALLTTRSASLIEGWGVMLLMLLVAGALLAICTDMIARRILL
jgi:ABC-type xylose transport system permease subunit